MRTGKLRLLEASPSQARRLVEDRWGGGLGPPEAEIIFDLGFGTSNGKGKFMALGHVSPDSPRIRHFDPLTDVKFAFHTT